MPPATLIVTLLTVTASAPSVEETIRTHVVGFNEAYAENDLETYFSYYAPDATLWFDTERVRLEDYKKSWYELVEGGGGVEENALSDIRIRLSPDGSVAVATYSLAVVTRYPDGRRTNERAAETDVWLREGGNWKIVHIHYAAEPAE